MSHLMPSGRERPAARDLRSAAEVWANRIGVRARLYALHRPVVGPPPAPELEPVVEVAPAEPDEPQPWRPTGARISDVVAKRYGLTRAEIRGDSRRAIYIKPRHIAMYLCVRVAGMSFPHTGRMFNRDHTTVLHGVKRITALCATYPAMAAEIDELTRKIEADHDAP
jgi:hypothetical protein